MPVERYEGVHLGDTPGGDRGGGRARRPADHDGPRGRVGAQAVDVAGHVRPRVLRDRDDGDRRRPVRPVALGDGGVPRLAPPGRPDDRVGPRVAEDGAGAAPDLRPDARAEVGHLDGRVRVGGRHVHELRRRPGRRHDRAGRRVRARLPAEARDADVRHPHAAEEGADARSRSGEPSTTLAAAVRGSLPRRARGARRGDAGGRSRAAARGARVAARRADASSSGSSRSSPPRTGPAATPAFWVVYELRSMSLPHRLRVKVGCDEGDATCRRSPALFPTANWHERETFDFYGIVFDGPPRPHADPAAGGLGGASRCARTSRSAGVPTWFHGATMPPIDERGMA